MIKRKTPICEVCNLPIYNLTQRARVHRECRKERELRWRRLYRLKKMKCPRCKELAIKLVGNGAVCNKCGWILSKWDRKG
jgi:hypothetical protein